MTSVAEPPKRFNIIGEISEANVVLISHYFNRKSVDGVTPSVEMAKAILESRKDAVLYLPHDEEFAARIKAISGSHQLVEWQTQKDLEKIFDTYKRNGRLAKCEQDLASKTTMVQFSAYMNTQAKFVGPKSLAPKIAVIIKMAGDREKTMKDRAAFLEWRNLQVTQDLEIEDNDDFIWEPSRVSLVKCLNGIKDKRKFHLVFVDFFNLLQRLPFQEESIKSVFKALKQHKFALLTPASEKVKFEEGKDDGKKA